MHGSAPEGCTNNGDFDETMGSNNCNGKSPGGKPDGELEGKIGLQSMSFPMLQGGNLEKGTSPRLFGQMSETSIWKLRFALDLGYLREYGLQRTFLSDRTLD